MNLLKPKSPIRVNRHAITVIRYAIHAIAVIYLIVVFYAAINGSILGDPVQYLLDFTGISALNLLLASLVISPVSLHLKFAQMLPLRKTLGVYAAIYALSHLGVFIAFELQFEWLLIVSEIIERPYITVGFGALIILTLMLLTSFKGAQKVLGKTWQKLHNWVYVAVFLACLHFLWAIKSTELAPIIYAVLGLLLLLARKNKIKRIMK